MSSDAEQADMARIAEILDDWGYGGLPGLDVWGQDALIEAARVLRDAAAALTERDAEANP